MAQAWMPLKPTPPPLREIGADCVDGQTEERLRASKVPGVIAPAPREGQPPESNAENQFW